MLNKKLKSLVGLVATAALLVTIIPTTYAGAKISQNISTNLATSDHDAAWTVNLPDYFISAGLGSVSRAYGSDNFEFNDLYYNNRKVVVVNGSYFADGVALTTDQIKDIKIGRKLSTDKYPDITNYNPNFQYYVSPGEIVKATSDPTVTQSNFMEIVDFTSTTINNKNSHLKPSSTNYLIKDKVNAIDGKYDFLNYERDSKTGGIGYVKVQFSGATKDYLQGYIDRAVTEYRTNYNRIQQNLSTGNLRFEFVHAQALATMILNGFNIVNNKDEKLNENTNFIVEYTYDGGKQGRTVVELDSVLFDDLDVDEAIRRVEEGGGIEALPLIVDDNGNVYLKFAGLPTDCEIQKIYIDTRYPLHFPSKTFTPGSSVSAYVKQDVLESSIDSMFIPKFLPTFTEAARFSVLPQYHLADNFSSNNKYNDTINFLDKSAIVGSDGRIENDNLLGRSGSANYLVEYVNNEYGRKGYSHRNIQMTGSEVIFYDILLDTDKIATKAYVEDASGNVYDAEIGNYSKLGSVWTEDISDSSKGLINSVSSPKTKYLDIKVNGLIEQTVYNFSKIVVVYEDGISERNISYNFNQNLRVKTHIDELLIVTDVDGKRETNTLNFPTIKNVVTPAFVGYDTLAYAVYVNNRSLLHELEVRGLVGNESYNVTNLSDNWVLVELSNLQANKDYRYVTLVPKYINSRGVLLESLPITLGTAVQTGYNLRTLFPSDNSATNPFTRTLGSLSEVWVDNEVEVKRINSTTVEITAQVKDPDDSIEDILVSYAFGLNGTFTEIDSKNVTVEKYYKTISKIDINSDNDFEDYISINNNTPAQPAGSILKLSKGDTFPSDFDKSNFVKEDELKSVSKAVKITVTNVPSNSDLAFRLNFNTKVNNESVAKLNIDSIGWQGAVHTGGLTTQRNITRYTTNTVDTGKATAPTIKDGSEAKVSSKTPSSIVFDLGIVDKDGIISKIEVFGARGATATLTSDKKVEIKGLSEGIYEAVDLVFYDTLNKSIKRVQLPTFEIDKTISGGSSSIPLGVTEFVSRFYTVALGRSADAEGLNYWTSNLVNKTFNVSYFFGNLLNEAEFITKVSTDEAFVKAIYTITVNRTADDEGLKFWMEKLVELKEELEDEKEAKIKLIEIIINEPEFKEYVEELKLEF